MLPGQGLVYRVRDAAGADGADLIAVDPATGRTQVLTHAGEGGSIALAALTRSRRP